MANKCKKDNHYTISKMSIRGVYGMKKLCIALSLSAVLLIVGCSNDSKENSSTNKNVSALTEKTEKDEAGKKVLKLGDEIQHKDDFFSYKLTISDFVLQKDLKKFEDGEKYAKENYAIYSTKIKLTNSSDEPSNFMTLKYGIVPVDDKGQ